VARRMPRVKAPWTSVAGAPSPSPCCRSFTRFVTLRRDIWTRVGNQVREYSAPQMSSLGPDDALVDAAAFSAS
jgi:hypothetical protein